MNSDQTILEYLYQFQGQWTSLWDGHFKGRENEDHMGKPIGIVNDVYYAMPEGTSKEDSLNKMKSLHERGFVGGCPCGCRGDFEITDLGLAYIGKDRTKPYTGYGHVEGSIVTGLEGRINLLEQFGYEMITSAPTYAPDPENPNMLTVNVTMSIVRKGE